MNSASNPATIARAALVAATMAIGMAVAGCGIGGSTGQDAGTPDVSATATPSGQAGLGTAAGGGEASGSGSGGSGGGGGQETGGGEDGSGPSPTPGGDSPAPPVEGAALERVLLTPVALVAPTRCFTEGLSTRYVDGYGTQVVDPRPHADRVATRVEHEGLTRLPMDQTNRRVNLLPGSSRAVEAVTGEWSVSVEVHMFLSGGFQLDYTRTHTAGQTGQFRKAFSSPVDGTCVVELVYGLTTSPA